MELYTEKRNQISSGILADRLRHDWNPRILPGGIDYWGAESLRPPQYPTYVGADGGASPSIQPFGASDRFGVPGGETFSNDIFGGDFFSIPPQREQPPQIIRLVDGDTFFRGEEIDLPPGETPPGDGVGDILFATVVDGQLDPFTNLALEEAMVDAMGGLPLGGTTIDEATRGGAIINVPGLMTNATIEGDAPNQTLVFTRKRLEVGLAISNSEDDENDVFTLVGPNGETTQVVVGVTLRDDFDSPGAGPSGDRIEFPLYECPADPGTGI